jgi:signal transduction histidine kinase
MDFPNRNRITERAVLRLLISGFALVLLLLGAVGAIAIQGTRSIEEDTAQAGNEQVMMAGLLGETRAGLNALAAALHEVARDPDAINRDAVMRELDEAEKGLRRAVAVGANSPDAARWRNLELQERELTTLMRGGIGQDGSMRDNLLAELLTRHDRIVAVGRELLEASAQRAAATDQRIEKEARALAGESSALLGTSMALALLCAGLTVYLARRSIRRIEWQASELNRVSWHMLQSQEATARRFSHELHDELGQSLAAVKSNLTSTRTDDLAARRADCVQLVDEAIANVRELSQLLRPVILDDFGLDAGLRWLTERFAQRTGLDAVYESNSDQRLPEATETHLFRIAQEALTNVARHSGATKVRVHLQITGGEVQLTVEDNGRGLTRREPSPETPTLGMTGMRARAREAGGELNLSSPAAGGLRIDVIAPVAGNTRDAEQEDAYSVS